MIGKNGLLSLLRFVALIIPAFVVLIELVVSRDMDDKVEMFSVEIDELRILEYSLLFVVIGGALILYRLLHFVQNSFVAFGIVLIFGSIPLAILSVWVMSARRGYEETSEQSFSEYFQQNIKETSGRILVLFPVLVGPGIAFWISSGTVNRVLSFGVFYNGWILTPLQFVSIGYIICAVKGVITTNSRYEDAESDAAGLVGYSTGVGIVLVLVYAVFTAPVYILFILAIRVPDTIFGLGPSSVIFNLPFLWSSAIYYALLAFDYDPDIE